MNWESRCKNVNPSRCSRWNGATEDSIRELNFVLKQNKDYIKMIEGLKIYYKLIYHNVINQLYQKMRFKSGIITLINLLIKIIYYKALEERYQEIEKNIRDLEKRQQEKLAEQQRAHFFNLREIDTECGQQCDQMMDENRKLDDHIQIQSQQCNKVKDDVARFNSTTQIQTMEVIEKVKKLVFEEFKEKINQLEKQVERIGQERLKIIRDIQQSNLEAQKGLRQITEQQTDRLKDKVRMEYRNLTVDNYQLQQFSSTITQDVVYRKEIETKVLEQLTKIKEKEFKINNHEVEQLNKINNYLKNDTIIILNLRKLETKRQSFRQILMRVTLKIINQLKILINQLNYFQIKLLKQFYQHFQEHQVF